MLKQNGFEHQSLSYLEKRYKDTEYFGDDYNESLRLFKFLFAAHTKETDIELWNKIYCLFDKSLRHYDRADSQKKSGRISRKFWKRASATESTARQTSMRRCKRKDCISKGFGSIIWNLRKRMRKRISTTSADIISAKCKNAKLQVYRREVTV